MNDIHTIVAESYARIFRQNMFNCGILAIELSADDIEQIFNLQGDIQIDVDLEKEIEDGKIEPIIVREKEINNFINILSRKTNKGSLT
mgnify:CR=1 FL=1